MASAAKADDQPDLSNLSIEQLAQINVEQLAQEKPELPVILATGYSQEIAQSGAIFY